MAKSVDEVVKDLMSREDRKDAEFRLALVMSQLGGIAKYITHDPKLNPNARLFGNTDDEKLAYGQVIVQVMGLAHARGINYNDSMKLGLANWADADWRKRQAGTTDPNKLVGKMPYPAFAEGLAYVADKKHTLDSIAYQKEKPILVMRHAELDDCHKFIGYVSGIVTDQGGLVCHAATISREMQIPCIVGTGNATEKIKHGSRIKLVPGENERGEVYIESSKRKR